MASAASSPEAAAASSDSQKRGGGRADGTAAEGHADDGGGKRPRIDGRGGHRGGRGGGRGGGGERGGRGGQRGGRGRRGRRGRGGGGRGGGGGAAPGGGEDAELRGLTAYGEEEEEDDGYTGPAPRSALFEKFYQWQGLVPDSEWDEWLSSLQRKLPVTFRLSSINGLHRRLLQTLQSDEFGLAGLGVSVEGRPLKAPTPLPWYPQSMGWYLNCSKGALRAIPALAPFRRWLMAEFDQGNLNRQEAVSMIPTLLLQVQPSHVTLDLCAAPGSKTAQILEDIHSSGAMGSGMVIANDSDSQRAYMLVHQLKRLGSPAFLVTTHEGQHFPSLYTQPPQSSSLPPSLLLFDRILCDVPCSGDGTLRKNLSLWARWTPNFAYGLHPLQISIAWRGLQMLKEGGLMVYSTCAFNPVEDEAVVAELLRRSNEEGKEDAVSLVDVSGRLPGLQRVQGMSSWRLMDGYGEAVELSDDIRQGGHPRYQPSMFPPTAAEAERFHLSRCIRVLPHHQDTGGFFIALLHKHRHTAHTHTKQEPQAHSEKPHTQPLPSEVQEEEKETKEEEGSAVAADATAAAAAESPPQPSSPAPPPSSSLSTPLPSSVGPVRSSAPPPRPLLHLREPRAAFNEDPFIPLNPEVVQHIMSAPHTRTADLVSVPLPCLSLCASRPSSSSCPSPLPATSTASWAPSTTPTSSRAPRPTRSRHPPRCLRIRPVHLAAWLCPPASLTPLPVPVG